MVGLRGGRGVVGDGESGADGENLPERSVETGRVELLGWVHVVSMG